MKLIGLTGYARSGKDTVADLLVAERSYHKTAFADPLKDGLCEILSCTREWLEENKDEVYAPLGVTPRMMMQTLGTEWARNTIRDDIWLVLMEQNLLHLQHSNGEERIVVSDVRFENEATMIRQMGGTVVHVVRPGVGIAESGHASEGGVLQMVGDVEIVNDTDLPGFLDRVRSNMFL